MPFLSFFFWGGGGGGGGGGGARGEERGVSSRGVGPDVGPKSERKKLEATTKSQDTKNKTKKIAFSCSKLS